MSTNNPVYVVISPARDEQANIETTLKSVISQTVRPTRWIIVDDGSRDLTGEIAQSYASKNTWIQVLRVPDRGYRSPGTGVICAFNEGYRQMGLCDWDYLVKLDTDLQLPNDYFERCFQYFIDEPNLGIAGGCIISQNGKNGSLTLEETPNFHVRGATKIYRREGWDKISGLIESPGWDTWDEIKANYYHWKTRTLRDVQLVQLRETGAVEGRWKDFVKNGRANYVCGYHPLFMVAKCLRRLGRNNTRISGLALLYGYLLSALKGVEQVREVDVVRYLRRQQVQRLLGRPSIWD